MQGLAERNCNEANRNCVFERLGTVVCTNRTFSNYRRGQVGKEFCLCHQCSMQFFMCGVVKERQSLCAASPVPCTHRPEKSGGGGGKWDITGKYCSGF
jgi:hypothetical protein